MSKIRSVQQRTDTPRQDEGPSTGAALLVGAVLGLVTDAVAFALPRQLSAAPLAAAGGVYLGFAVADGRQSALLVQTGELLGFTALAALAVQRDSPGLLGADWLAHVTWGRAAPPGPRAHQGAVLVPAALHRLRRGPRCAAAHRPALAGGQLSQRFAGRRPGAGLAGRARISHPMLDHRTAHVSTERTVKSLPDGQLIRLLADV